MIITNDNYNNICYIITFIIIIIMIINVDFNDDVVNDHNGDELYDHKFAKPMSAIEGFD